MSPPNVEFHSVEDYNFSHKRKWIHLLFYTERFSLLQVKYTYLNNGRWKLETFRQEPDLNMFTKEVRLYIEKVCRIVWRMLYDAPAAKDRFEGKT